MKRRGIIIASIVGLVLAVVELILLPITDRTTVNSSVISIVVAFLGILAAGIAGRVILGTRSVHRYFRLAVPVFAGISGLGIESAVSNWLISQQVFFGPAPTTVGSSVTFGLVLGAIAYLIAATVYGFAGAHQGVGVGARVGLLLLLLLAVIPVLNVLGMIGFVIAGFTRKPAEATPAPPAASE